MADRVAYDINNVQIPRPRYVCDWCFEESCIESSIVHVIIN